MLSIWSDDEEEQEGEEEEKSHLSKAEAKRRKRVEEEEAAKREQRLLDGEVGGRGFHLELAPQVDQPNSEPEFERLVVTSPDSSLVWIQYMAWCVQVRRQFY